MTGEQLAAEANVPSLRRIALASNPGMQAGADDATLSIHADGAPLWTQRDIAAHQAATTACMPTPAHTALARYQSWPGGSNARGPSTPTASRSANDLPWTRRLSLFTQNLDDLHERAGSPSVTHVFGELLLQRCTACGRTSRANAPSSLLSTPPPLSACCQAIEHPCIAPPGTVMQHQANLAIVESADTHALILIGVTDYGYPANAMIESAQISEVPVIVVAHTHVAIKDTVQVIGELAGIVPKLFAVAEE